jgi:mono/diheme cytochrome c family protein
MARRASTAACLAAAALIASGCGSESVKVPQDDPQRQGAVLFAQKCGSCHTLEAAGTQGSSVDVSDRERVDGPNFNARKENVEDVLFAIANGGFSGAIMPENIVTGPEAQAVAEFLAANSGGQETQGQREGPGSGG